MQTLRHSAIVLLLCMLGAAAQTHAATNLDLLGGRFQVSAEWLTAAGASGQAEAIPYSAETGLFWFFAPGKVELVVKMIDACVPPFNRFWFFASGLTNTEVTITVVDNWSGQTQTYHHAGGSLFAPLADTEAFATCGFSAPACWYGNRADIQASPRPDSSAENLALLIGDGVVAEQALYERLHADLAAIRAAEPAVADVSFYNLWWDPQRLLVSVTTTAFARIRAGTYHEWDCLNTWYGGTIEYLYQFSPLALLRFAPLVHPHRLGADYDALPSVTSTGAEETIYVPADPPIPPDMCAIADGFAFDYFIGGTLWRYFRVEHAGSAPVAMGTWNGLTPAPSWRQRLDECNSRLTESANPQQ